MTFRPDYGSYLLQQGVTRSTLQYFYSVPITHISIVSNRLFTTLINLYRDGVEYAVSFDFDMTFIGNVIALAPIYVQGEIMVGLSENKGQPYTIEISHPFVVGIEAILGQPQMGKFEQFVPFVVQKVFAPS